MLLRFLTWVLLGIVGLLIIVVLLPIIVLVFLFIAIVSLFSQSTARIWLSRAKAGTTAGAQTVKSTVNRHTDGSHATAKKAGQRKTTVVDAQVVDVTEDSK